MFSSSSLSESLMKDDQLIVDAVRCGDINTIENYLNEENDESINKLYDFGQNKLSILMGSCYYKHENVVRMLLKRRYPPSIDLLGIVVFDSSCLHPEIAKGVPALWIATAMNDLSIVELLVEMGGANVNQLTESDSTAFRVACFNGNLSICKYLVKHGANVNQCRKGNYTNIMVSAYWKHFHILKYLIDELNCDPNEQSEHGKTALHNAVESGSVEIVQYLLEKGLQLTKDNQTNLTPLLYAAKGLNFDIINLFENYCSKIDWIEAKELIGAIYASQQSTHYHLDKAYQYLTEACILRNKFHLPKILSKNVHEIFDFEEEYQTLDQLKEIYENVDRFHIQSLLIQDRLLGLNNTDYFYSLRYYGACCIDSNQFNKGLHAWIYQLHLSEKYSIDQDNSHLFRTFLHLFTKMIQNNHINDLFGQALFEILFKTYQLIEQKDENIDYNIHTLLYLITIFATISEEERLVLKNYQDLCQLIRSIIRSNDIQTNHSNSTLLHLSVNSQTEEYYHYKYPCSKTIHLLIQFGVDIDQMDKERNTSLHLLIKTNDKSSQIYQLIDLIYHYGHAHLDFLNIYNQTPIQLTNQIQIQKYLKDKKKIFNLKCLCATFIQLKQIPFQFYLNKSLSQFVSKH